MRTAWLNILVLLTISLLILLGSSEFFAFSGCSQLISSSRPASRSKGLSRTMSPVLDFYRLYGSELRARRAEMAQFGIVGLSDATEAEITYMRVRSAKPKTIWEISPHQGYMTLWIMLALRENAAETDVRADFTSFDLSDKISVDTKAALKKGCTWDLVVGDFKATVDEIMKERMHPNYLVLDSFHSYEFGQMYINKVFPLLQSHPTYVSIHDVFNPGFWSDTDAEFRVRAQLPDWIANEEGQVILNWIAFNPELVNEVFTSSKLYNKDYDKVQEYRVSLGHKHDWGMNPTLYFTLL